MNKKISLLLLITACLITASFFFISKSYAENKKQIAFSADHPPYLENIVMNADKDTITLSLTVTNPFDHEIKNLLLNGVPQKVTLLIKTKVNRINLFLVKFNREINNETYTHSIKYDNLKKLFTVGNDTGEKPIETTSYREAIKLATEFNHLTVLNGSQIEKDRSYEVEAQSEIRKVRLPFHLEYLFFFLSAWDRKSNNYTIDIPERLINQALTR